MEIASVESPIEKPQGNQQELACSHVLLLTPQFWLFYVPLLNLLPDKLQQANMKKGQVRQAWI